MLRGARNNQAGRDLREISWCAVSARLGNMLFVLGNLGTVKGKNKKREVRRRHPLELAFSEFLTASIRARHQ